MELRKLILSGDGVRSALSKTMKVPDIDGLKKLKENLAKKDFKIPVKPKSIKEQGDDDVEKSIEDIPPVSQSSAQDDDKSPEAMEMTIKSFFRKNKSPSDEEIHSLADSMDIPYEELEEIIYDLLGRYLDIGKNYDRSDSDFDEDELSVGVSIEMEHTDNPEIAKEIAKDHISGVSDYYTNSDYGLSVMEKKAGKSAPVEPASPPPPGPAASEESQRPRKLQMSRRVTETMQDEESFLHSLAEKKSSNGYSDTSPLPASLQGKYKSKMNNLNKDMKKFIMSEAADEMGENEVPTPAASQKVSRRNPERPVKRGSSQPVGEGQQQTWD